jgi:outer membrane protein assembly factor BamB
MRRPFLLVLPALTLLASLGRAADWPQFRGPNRDDLSAEKGLLQSWPKDGPPVVWTTKGLGGGFSSVSVAGDRIYTLGNRDKKTHIVALDKATGKILWSSPVGPAGGSLGCTPTVDGGHIYALGQEGDLVCVDAKGKRLWHRNLRKEFGGVYGGWKYCESPLIDGDRVVVTPGGKTATMVALAKKNGAVLWKCPIAIRHPEAGYASIVITEACGVRQYVQLLNGGLVGVSNDGHLLWKYERLGPNTANIPTPIILGDRVFASAGYGKGGALVRLKVDSKEVNAEEVYFNRQLTNKHGGVLRVGDYVYGDTDDQGRPFCAAVKTGKVQWKRDGNQGHGGGSASVTYADGLLYFHYQDGIMSLVEASPKAYHEVSWFKVPKTSGPSWAHPVVSGGRLYLREGDLLYCYDVHAEK